MEHIAIDLGGRESQICVRSASGEILEEKKHATRTLGRYLRRRPPSRVILETCAEAFSVADAVLELGHEVRVVPASLVGTLGVGSRRLKTDKRDARILSEVSCRIDLPSVHVPKEESRRRKTMCGMREQLIGARTQLINCVRGWLRGRALRVRTGAIATFAARVRNASAEIPVHVERLLSSIEQLTEQIRDADQVRLGSWQVGRTATALVSIAFEKLRACPGARCAKHWPGHRACRTATTSVFKDLGSASRAAGIRTFATGGATG